MLQLAGGIRDVLRPLAARHLALEQESEYRGTVTIAEVFFGNEWPLLMLIFCPGIVGFFSLIGGLVLVLGGRKEEGAAPSTGRVILGVILLVLALGIGGCYAVMMVGSSF